MPRTVLTAEFMHESNTFSKILTGVEAFRADMLLLGEAAQATRAEANTELGGFLEVATAEGWRVIHPVSAHACPQGPVTAEAWEMISGLILDAAKTHAGEIDGVLLGLHGSMATELGPDGEGDLLVALRAILGPNVPIAVTLDLHAMVTERMCEAADILVSYKTYPHVDMRDTGRHAARLLASALNGESDPKSLFVRPPMLFEANGGRTDMPLTLALYDAARAAEAGAMLAVSVNAGFSGADASFSGPSVVVNYDAAQPGAEAEAQALANGLARRMWDQRVMQKDPVFEVDETLEICRNWQGLGPLVIGETSDNPGSGAYGDSTNLLAALIAANIPGTVFSPMIDPAAAAELHQYAVGDEVVVTLGGKQDPAFGGGPLTVTGRIQHLSPEGIYTGDGPMHGGLTYSFGKTAVLKVGEVEILVVTTSRQMLDLQQLRAFGIEPTARHILSVKSKQHFRAAFEPIAGRVIICDAGGLATPNLSRRPYSRVPRPLWPLDPEAVWAEA